MAVSELVHLRGGLTVSVPALRLLWKLENDGFTIRLLDDRLQVSPIEQLTSAIAQRIREHRDELLMLVRYQPDDSHLFTDCIQKPVPLTPIMIHDS
jgi:hypothetical protein